MSTTYYLYQESAPHLFIGTTNSDKPPNTFCTVQPVPGHTDQYEWVINKWQKYQPLTQLYATWDSITHMYVSSTEIPINQAQSNMTSILPDIDNLKIKWDGTEWVVPELSYFQDQKYKEITSIITTYMKEGILDNITGNVYKYDTSLEEQTNFSHYIYLATVIPLVKVKTYSLKENGDASKKADYIHKKFTSHNLEQIKHIYNKGIAYIGYYREHLLELKNLIYNSSDIDVINNITVTPYVY